MERDVKRWKERGRDGERKRWREGRDGERKR